MEFRRAAVSFCLRGVLNILCEIDCREFVDALSKNKPLLVIFNHINFLEVPILVAHTYPLKVTGIVKVETWKNPFFAFLFNTYNAIPINRNGAFTESFKRVRQAIDNGFYMCVAPEGTRSKDGMLGRGKAGIIELALDMNVPILPVAHHGGEQIWENMKHFRRTQFNFKAGRPFMVKYEGRPGREDREKILTEVMVQMANLLPENMRGAYSGYNGNDFKYLDFI